MPSSPSRNSARSGPSAAELERLLDRGRALHSKGRLQEALPLYQAVLAAAPANPDALHLTGVCYLNLGMPDLGIAFLRQAIAKHLGAADYRVNLANALLRRGQLAQAATELAQACALQPADAEARATLAGVQLALGHTELAEASYAQAIAAGPERAEWHAALARLQYQRWASVEALASAARASELSGSTGQGPVMGFAQPGAIKQRPPVIGALRYTPALSEADLARAAAERDLLVVDDFLPDPGAARQQALQLCERTAVRRAGANYPGLQTPAQPCGDAMQRIADWLGQGLKWDSPDHGAVRCSLAADAVRADVHVDSPTLPNIYGGVLYLSLPEHCEGGTSFYRHRATGWSGRPDMATLNAAGHDSFAAFQERHLPSNRQRSFAEWQSERDANWDWLFEVPMRFNRLVIFRSDFFHAISGLFGTALSNGRLVQLFHFEGRR